MNNSFYTEDELSQIGFKNIGYNVLISKKTSIYSAENISIGDNVRIDDFCILSGKIELGNFIHISAYSALYGGLKGIKMKDFSGLSSRCVVYALSDDYSGNYMTNSTIANKYKNVTQREVIIEKHALVGSGTCIMPGVIIHEGVAVGAMSFVNISLDAWWIYAGVPCKKLKRRNMNLLNFEEKLL